MKFSELSLLCVHLLKALAVKSVCDAAVWKVVLKVVGTEKRHGEGPHISDRYTVSSAKPSSFFLLQQMYLAAAFGGSRRREAVWKNKSRQLRVEWWEDFFHFCLSDRDGLILSFCFPLSSSSYSMKPSHAGAS